jgi:aminoglycoside phosphotransferase (APT) family kinase protein
MGGPIMIDKATIAAILAQANLEPTVETLEFVAMPDYAVNGVCFINDDLVLRYTTEESGRRRLARERELLEELKSLPVVPKVLAEGLLPGTDVGVYLLQTRIPGQTMRQLWASVSEARRIGLVRELAGYVREFHRISRSRYRIGFYQSAIRDWEGSWIDGHDRYVSRLLGEIHRRSPSPAEREVLKRAERYYEDHREALAYATGPHLGHGDLHFLNVLATDSGITGILDWEWAFDGGVEPEFDLDALVRWSVFPADFADGEPPPATEEFRSVMPEVLRAYLEVAAIPRLYERLTIYQIERDLFDIQNWKRSIPKRAIARLAEWVDDAILDLRIDPRPI